jgi:hypothetical protein
MKSKKDSGAGAKPLARKLGRPRAIQLHADQDDALDKLGVRNVREFIRASVDLALKEKEKEKN